MPNFSLKEQLTNRLTAAQNLEQIQPSKSETITDADLKNLYMLAYQYDIGLGTRQNKEEAKKWYQLFFDLNEFGFDRIARLTGEKSDAEALFILGCIYWLDQVKDDAGNNIAVQYFRLAADKGHALAQYQLGMICKTGLRGLPKDVDQFVTWIKKAAQQGLEIAQVQFGWLMEQQEEYKEALKWYLKAAEQGNAVAQYHIGMMYNNQLIFDKKMTSLTLEWFKKAATQENAAAEYAMGQLHQFGRSGLKKDAKTAFGWYQKAAKQGYAPAQYKIGLMLQNGIGVERNIDAANEQYKLAENQNYKKGQYQKDFFKWCQLAACEHIKSAQFDVALMYERGIGVTINENLAIAWYKLAAEKEHADACFRLGQIYSYKNMHLLSKDYYKTAASLGHMEALYWMGNYSEGRPANSSHKKRYTYRAFKWYLEAAKRGHAAAQYKIGEKYEIGCAVKDMSLDETRAIFIKDVEKAIEWYEKAAEQGNFDAKAKLSDVNKKQLYEHISRIRINRLRKHEELAESGNPEAQYAAGKLYENDARISTEKSSDESFNLAFNYYKDAAEQGYAPAQYAMGRCLAKGIGTEKNEEQAIDWLKKSASQGYALAKYYLGKISERKEEYLEADMYYQQAVDKKNAKAQYHLGLFYLNGPGKLQKDIEKAIGLFKQAAEQGHKEAQDLNIAYRSAKI